jgi:hypothetical protein
MKKGGWIDPAWEENNALLAGKNELASRRFARQQQTLE